MRIDPKGLLLRVMFGHWGRVAAIEGGYTILLPSPADMPFLLRFALEGLRHLDLDGCRQVVVLGDGSSDDQALRAVVDEMADPRVEMVRVGPLARFFVHGMGRPGGEVANWTHWAMIVEGIRQARGEYVFLHDADAFFLEAEGPERLYREASARGMKALGVTARNDPFFVENRWSIPGTWELMFSNRWARSHAPIDHKGRSRPTPGGIREFDTMLYPQYLELDRGGIGVLDPPPGLVHFSGSITTYRAFRDRAGRPVVDELFRILLLALLEELVSDDPRRRALPRVEELARGLEDPSAPATYSSSIATQEYPTFRAMVRQMAGSPIMRGERAEKIEDLLRPFDDHFADRMADPALGSLARLRRDGLG